ncbi:DNA topoisomerase IV [Haloflavibacter putidus]|uniref:DNA topoisomerase IV n=1 Tax=Haloflavibacter putidus TaxID=2576776 RepID=A0A507ZWV3_9FLAO|nr:DNA topoisomerase IV [Haloflavibacter putidus]TQD40178.1 DNA topoisomerase IV [Haloflavibacter putidus]
MQRILYLLLLCLLVTACYSPERNCAKFKTGAFEFESYLNGELVKTTFVRNDTMEIDYFKDHVDSSSVRWINDCEYILKNMNPKNMAEEKPLHMKILTTDGDTYTFEFSIVGDDNKQKGTARKVK